MKKVSYTKETIQRCVEMVRDVAQKVNDERASKCGYDLLMGIGRGDVVKRIESWERYLDEVANGDGSHTDAERDGVWVPAIIL